MFFILLVLHVVVELVLVFSHNNYPMFHLLSILMVILDINILLMVRQGQLEEMEQQMDVFYELIILFYVVLFIVVVEVEVDVILLIDLLYVLYLFVDVHLLHDLILYLMVLLRVLASIVFLGLLMFVLVLLLYLQKLVVLLYVSLAVYRFDFLHLLQFAKNIIYISYSRSINNTTTYNLCL